MPEQRRQKLQDSGLIAWPVFSEIIAMDEEEEDFSQQLFYTFIKQAVDTFKKINKDIETKDLADIAESGHFLKGSAAALGIVAVSNQCERIQNYGLKQNTDDFELDQSKSDEKVDEKSDEYWLLLVEDALKKAEEGFTASMNALSEYYDDESLKVESKE